MARSAEFTDTTDSETNWSHNGRVLSFLSTTFHISSHFPTHGKLFRGYESSFSEILGGE